MFNKPHQVTWLAVKDALGFPAIMLIAGMAGFGSLARESSLTLGIALGATVGIWGLPGQVALAELHATGVSALFVILAVSLANARFLPMAVSFIPIMRRNSLPYGWMFILVQLLSINSWAVGLRRFPEIVPNLRQRYYIVFALICMIAGLIGTALGFASIGAIPRPIALGLIFLNPLFLAILLAQSRNRSALRAVLIGAPLGTILHLASPEWGLLATGIIGGTIAFWASRTTALESDHD